MKTDRVETDNLGSIPRDFYWMHKFVTLTSDLMFVNGIEILTTLSRKIRLFSAEHVKIHTAAQLTISSKK